MTDLTLKELDAFVRVADLVPIIERLKEMGADVAKLGLPQHIIETLENANKNAEFIQSSRANSASLIIKGFCILDEQSQFGGSHA